MRSSALLLALALALPKEASADWVPAVGTYAFPPEMTETDACQKAEDRARAAAVRQVTGETLSADDVMRCTEQGDEAECDRNSTVWTMVGGEIVSIRNRTQRTTPYVDNIRQCTVAFQADVHAAQGKPDPSFDIGVVLNNAVFRNGDKLTVTLRPSQSMAIQIFQWVPYEKGDTQVVRIYPNRFDNLSQIEKPITIPSESGAKRYDLKASFPSSQPATRKMVDEYLMVVATRKPVAFRERYSLDDFNRVVAEIPLGDRRIVRRGYQILRGGE